MGGPQEGLQPTTAGKQDSPEFTHSCTLSLSLSPTCFSLCLLHSSLPADRFFLFISWHDKQKVAAPSFSVLNLSFSRLAQAKMRPSSYWFRFLGEMICWVLHGVASIPLGWRVKSESSATLLDVGGEKGRQRGERTGEQGLRDSFWNGRTLQRVFLLTHFPAVLDLRAGLCFIHLFCQYQAHCPTHSKYSEHAQFMFLLSHFLSNETTQIFGHRYRFWEPCDN